MADGDGLVLPQYGRRSLAEVLPSVLAAMGVPAMPNSLGLEPVRSVCLLLVDGLGARQLAANGADAPFLAGLTDLGPLTAGFPSSTSTSLTTLGTGLPPGSHGIVGITFRVGGGQLLDSLHWTSHATDDPVDLRESVPPERLQPSTTTFQAAAADGVDVRHVAPRAFRDSGLTRAAIRGAEYRGVHALGDLAAEAITAITAPGRVLCNAYHADLDGLGHVYGPGSLQWRLQLGAVDRLAATIAEYLPADARLVVTADHGMVEVPEERKFDADTDPVLGAGVAMVGGDARSRLVYAEPGAANEVLAAWRERLGPHATVLPVEQAVEAGWFGAVPSESVRARLGDVVVAMRGNAAVVRSRAEPRISALPGQHGSLTPDEQEVPLLVAGRP